MGPFEIRVLKPYKAFKAEMTIKLLQNSWVTFTEAFYFKG